MKMFRSGCRIIILASLPLLAGCATLPYEPPASGPTASLFVTLRSAQGMASVNYAAEPHNLFKRSTQILAMQEPGPDVSQSITVAAGQVQYFNFGDMAGPGQCNVNGSFVPVAGQSYALLAGDTAPVDTSFFGKLFKGPENGAKCYMELAVRTPDGQMQAIPMSRW